MHEGIDSGKGSGFGFQFYRKPLEHFKQGRWFVLCPKKIARGLLLWVGRVRECFLIPSTKYN